MQLPFLQALAGWNGRLAGGERWFPPMVEPLWPERHQPLLLFGLAVAVGESCSAVVRASQLELSLWAGGRCHHMALRQIAASAQLWPSAGPPGVHHQEALGQTTCDAAVDIHPLWLQDAWEGEEPSGPETIHTRSLHHTSHQSNQRQFWCAHSGAWLEFWRVSGGQGFWPVHYRAASVHLHWWHCILWPCVIALGKWAGASSWHKVDG